MDDDFDDNNDSRQSADDALEPADDIYNPAIDEERLAEDNEPPAAPADDIPGPHIPADDPRTDTDLDSDELYSEGIGKATDTTEQEIGPSAEERPLEPEDDA